jgi:hypothetical protein
VQWIDNQLGIGGRNILLEALHYVEFSICKSIQVVAGRTPLIQCRTLGSHFNNLSMQKLEVGIIPGFGNLVSCNLERFVGFFLYGTW